VEPFNRHVNWGLRYGRWKNRCGDHIFGWLSGRIPGLLNTRDECVDRDIRLKRDFGRQRFGDTGYAREELVAELGAAFLCADLDITPEVREDHAAYLAHWLTILREDKRAIFNAATHAQRATDYLNNLQQHQEPRTEDDAAA
jgi:antirestriction protein ArdC